MGTLKCFLDIRKYFFVDYDRFVFLWFVSDPRVRRIQQENQNVHSKADRVFVHTESF